MLHGKLTNTAAFASAATLLLALGASCAANRQGNSNSDVPRTIAAYRLGVAAAMEEIRAGGATIHTFGYATREGTDPQTQLPYKSVAGDAVPAETYWRVLGHNDTIRAYKGLPLAPLVPN